jgi:hypothetical protein
VPSGFWTPNKNRKKVKAEPTRNDPLSRVQTTATYTVRMLITMMSPPPLLVYPSLPFSAESLINLHSMYPYVPSDSESSMSFGDVTVADAVAPVKATVFEGPMHIEGGASLDEMI